MNQISRARNAGARAARGRFLVFVDADTLVPAALLHEALEALASGRACGGGAAVRMEGVNGGVAGRMVWLWNAVSSGRRLAAGSFVFVLREAFEAVGGFSERVYASEEIWLSRAVGRWGRRARAALRDPARPPGPHQRPQGPLVPGSRAPGGDDRLPLLPLPGPLAAVLLALVPAGPPADRRLTGPCRARAALGAAPHCWRDPASRAPADLLDWR